MFTNEQNKNKSSIDKLFEQSNSTKRYRKGQCVYQEGELAIGIFRVQKGRVKIWKHGYNSTRSLILYFAYQSELFGIIDFFKEGNKRRCSATAMDMEVIIQFIPFSAFKRFLIQDVVFRQEVLNIIGNKEQTIFKKYSELQSNNIDKRVYRTLKYLAKSKGETTNKGIVLKAITHQDLSDYIGVSRQSITNAFKRLKEEGKIDYCRKRILIKNNQQKP